VRPMKVPWWTIPGLAAIVLTTGSVAAAEGTFSSTRVALPREVQLSPPGAGTIPAPPVSTSTTVDPAGPAPADRVVYPSRPVITQSGPSDAVKKTADHGADATAPPVTLLAPSPGPVGDGGGSASGSPVSPTTTLGPVTGTTMPTPTPTTTTIPVVPPTTTTTTTRPRWGEGGDE